MSYIHRNNLKQFPDPYLSPTGYDKVDKERMKRFLEINDIVSWAPSYFAPRIRGKHGRPDEMPFNDHYRIYFKKNGDQIYVAHPYVYAPEKSFDVIRAKCKEWAGKWGYACEVYPPEEGWYFKPEEGCQGAACVIFHKPNVEVLMPE